MIRTLYQWWQESSKIRILTFRMSRHNHYQLQMICDAINSRLDEEYELTPEMITSRVMETFVEEAFADSTNRIVESIVPELRKKKKRRPTR